MKNSKRTFPEVPAWHCIQIMVSSHFLLSVMRNRYVMFFVLYVLFSVCLLHYFSIMLVTLLLWVLAMFYGPLELWFILWLTVLLPVLLWWLWVHFTVKSRFWYIRILFHFMKWMTHNTRNNITIYIYFLHWISGNHRNLTLWWWQCCQCSPGQRFHQMWVSSLAVRSSTAS